MRMQAAAVVEVAVRAHCHAHAIARQAGICLIQVAASCNWVLLGTCLELECVLFLQNVFSYCRMNSLAVECVV